MFDEGWQLGVIESYKDKLYYIEYGRRAASLPAANDLIIRHCGKRRKVNDLADQSQFPMRLFGNNVDAKRGSWALLKPQPKPQLAAQPAQKGKRARGNASFSACLPSFATVAASVFAPCVGV